MTHGVFDSEILAGRQMLDGSLIANEIINVTSKEKLRLLLFKVDFEKAFDSVNWNFLMNTMAQMGFGVKWRKWIYACLSSALVSILINGSPSKEFPMKRSLRQGDPLSPFLFSYCYGSSTISHRGSLERRQEYCASLQLFAWLPAILLLRSARGKKYEEDCGLDRRFEIYRWNFKLLLCWTDKLWLKDLGPLKDCSPGLFALEQHKDCLVADRWVLEEDVWQGKWAWTRKPSK
ncbi:cysteine-rich receptor-like protein kinase [Tanacetum coccineum]